MIAKLDMSVAVVFQHHNDCLCTFMKQRVGIARALAIEPRMLLMDEPFSALDALTRGALQDEIIALRNANKQTVFMALHDTYFVWSWELHLLVLLLIVVLLLGAAALIKYLFFK